MAASRLPAAGGESVLTEIETALFHLRRIWAKPEIVRKLREQGPSERPVHTSSLLVVYAVAHLCSAGAGAQARRTAADRAAPGGGDDGGDGDVTVGAVAERLEIDPSTASRVVGHAIDAGFVARLPSPRDARRANLQLTDAGRHLQQVADRFRQAYLAELLADWTDGERTAFARLLTRFTEAAAQTPMDPAVIEKIFAAARGRDTGTRTRGDTP
jgi:DNA-binding MarR family transcriptional regulator